MIRKMSLHKKQPKMKIKTSRRLKFPKSFLTGKWFRELKILLWTNYSWNKKWKNNQVQTWKRRNSAKNLRNYSRRDRQALNPNGITWKLVISKQMRRFRKNRLDFWSEWSCEVWEKRVSKVWSRIKSPNFRLNPT